MPSLEDAAEALPSVPGISGSLGYGRGRPVSPQPTQTGANINEENRHALPVRRAICWQQARPSPVPASATPRLMGEDAVKQALGILTKRAEETGFTKGRGGRGGTGRGRGRGMGRGIGARGRGKGRGRGWGVAGKISAVDDTRDLFLGDHVDDERLVEQIGEDKWNEICEAIDSVSGDIVPDPLEDIYENALHTNMMVSVCLHSRGQFNSSSLVTGGKRSLVHKDGDYHRAVHVWIYAESTKELLLQHRADCKDSWPGQWDISSAGHISAGDTSLISARHAVAIVFPVSLFMIHLEKMLLSSS